MDLALVSRLAKSQFLMDSTATLTRGVNPLESALLAAVPLADLGLPTLVLRNDDHGYLGQIRHRMGDRYAYLACLAPVPRDLDQETQWLHLIDGLVQTAGKRGAQTLRAEVPESEDFVIHLLRRAGFLVYSRQVIYRHTPGNPIEAERPQRVSVRMATEVDLNRILALQGQLVPSIVQQAIVPNDKEDINGFVVETMQDGRLVGYVEVVEGKVGIMLKPYLHPDIFEDEATRIMAEILRSLPRIDRLPVYVTVLAIQEWLRLPLQRLHLEEGGRQAVFVKNMALRVRQTDEIVQAAKDIVFGTVVSAYELGLDQDPTP